MKLFVGAKALVQRPDGKILLVREGDAYQDGTNIGLFGVVGGRIESEESLLDGLRREVKEESGLAVTVGRVLHASDNFTVINGERVHIVRIYFLCATTDSEVRLSNDHDEYKWIDPRLINSGMLMDGLEQVFEILVDQHK